MSMPAEHLTRSPTLRTLLAGFADAPAVALTGITNDSRRVSAGAAFLAVDGATHCGLDFAQAAIEKGAAAVIYDRATATVPDLEPTMPAVGVDDLAGKMGEISNRFFARPSTDLAVLGVTGTNGKSTVSWMLARTLSNLDKPCAYSGTLGHGVEDLVADDTMTSPDVIELNRRLAEFRDVGAGYAAIEVSSHALDQGRVDGIVFDAALFTNLSRDHLDYHGDIEAYGAAKAKLFNACPVTRRIVSLDSEFGTQLAFSLGDRATTVSTVRSDKTAQSATFALQILARDVAGTHVGVRSEFGAAEFLLPMPGDFNVSNAGLVLACLCTMDVSLDDACLALSSLCAPPGRMQRVDAGAGSPAVFVDYAHTPAALSVTLEALRAHTRGALWCVFGCGGDRDAGKRPLMGSVAERMSDRVVVTNDNPRGEAPDAIVAEILAGTDDPRDIVVIEDRGAAIAWSIAEARPGDSVLIAGKGHEGYQLIGREVLDFSDYAVAKACLDQREST